MKKTRTLLLLAGMLLGFYTYAQQPAPINNVLIYSFIVNVAPDQFNVPLVGFVNIAGGSHKSAHIGFINYNQRDLYGAQVSFINTIGGNLKGTQVGFINTTCKQTEGIQVGFVNTSIGYLKGAQVGFVNTVCRPTEGLQVGFVNSTIGTLKGGQVGFVNTALKGTTGGQIGFVNVTKSLRGVQVGFVNYADSVKGGVPIGFISIVRKGGYQALELSCNEMYPVNLSFKIGIKQLYTSLTASYNDNLAKPFALGVGLGSILPISKHVYFNPEVNFQNTLDGNYQEIISLAGSFGYNITPELQVLAGPSLSWSYNWNNVALNTPAYYLYHNTLDAHNNLTLGVRLGLRYSFGDVK